MSLSDGRRETLWSRSLRPLLLGNVKPFLVMLGWGTTIAAATMWAIFQGLLLPKQTISAPSIWLTGTLLLGVYYIMFFGISFLSGLCIGDMGKSIVSFIGAYVIGATVIYEVLSLPGLVSSDIAFRESLAMLSVNWTFIALFPFPLFLGLFGGIVGSALQETIVG